MQDLDSQGLLIPDWSPWTPAANVRALVTTRHSLQGVSPAPYASFNLGDHVGDRPEHVAANRRQLRALLPAEPLWLRQVHGIRVLRHAGGNQAAAAEAPEADAVVAQAAGRVCAIMTADCLPILLSDQAGTVVAAAHAGWRGLAGGVIEATLVAMERPADQLMAWLGPAIGPQAFEVGAEVRAAFCQHDPQAALAFVAHGPDKWLCDLYLLARQRLQAAGVSRVAGGGACTHTEAEQFYSYRREGVSGRMASLIWLE